MEPELRIAIAGAQDAGAIGLLRTLDTPGAPEDAEFEPALAAWLADEGDRRTTWLARLGEEPVGMGSLYEYHRMPRPGRLVSAWGYLGNMFVREEHRDRGIGSALLSAIVAAADARGYARLVLSPTMRAVPFYLRNGFVVPDVAAAGDRLLVRPHPEGRP